MSIFTYFYVTFLVVRFELIPAGLVLSKLPRKGVNLGLNIES